MSVIITLMEIAPTTDMTANALRHGHILAEWQLSLRGSEHTRRAYLRNMGLFCTWLDERGLDLLTVKRVHVDGWRHTLTGADATVAQRLAAISSFYRHATLAGTTTRNPVESVARPKVSADHSSTQGLSIAECRALLEAARADGPRSYALVSLLLFTGLRLSEALNANTPDYGHDSGHRTLTVQRKGGKRQKVVVPPPAVEALNVYLQTTGQELVTAAGEGLPLFTTAKGNRVDPSEVFRTVRRLARAAGIEGNISPHSLRHAFATVALDAGATLHDLQDSMGHADPRTTRRYDRARNNLTKSAGYDVARALA
jgi:integrase/recombinase XerD